MKMCAVIPAAGRGSRMKVSGPKILLRIDSEYTIWDILYDNLKSQVDHIHVVLSSASESLFLNSLSKHMKIIEERDRISTSIQRFPLGMGDAVFGAQSFWSNFDVILVVWGDQVNLSSQTISAVVSICDTKRSLILPLVQSKTPYVQYDLEDNVLVKVRQTREGDVCDSEGLVDVGLFALSVQGLTDCWTEYLRRSERGANTGEINFLPFLSFLSQACGWRVQPIYIQNPIEARGVNTVADLQFARTNFAKSKKYP